MKEEEVMAVARGAGAMAAVARAAAARAAAARVRDKRQFGWLSRQSRSSGPLRYSIRL